MFESERRDLAHVPRWGIIRVNRRQSVAEHSYFVTCYGLEIAKRIGWPAVFDDDHEYEYEELHTLALYLLRHDESETLEGDIPGPIKRVAGFDGKKINHLLEKRFGPPPIVTPEMKSIKKAADLVDECLYLAGELNSGNGFVRSALENSKNRLSEAIGELPGKQPDRYKLFGELRMAIAHEETCTKDISGFAGT